MRSEAEGQVRELLTRKVGPLPVYGWAVISGGMLVGFLYLRRKNGAGGYVDDSGAAIAPGYAAGGYGLGSGGASGGGQSPFYPTPPTNPDSPTLPAEELYPAGGTGSEYYQWTDALGRVWNILVGHPVPQAALDAGKPVTNASAPYGDAYTTPQPVAQPSAGIPPVVSPPSSPAPSGSGVGPQPIPNVPSGQGVPPAGVAPLINIPQTWLTPGAWNEITSPGGTIGGFEGWTAWVNTGGDNWQQYNAGEYSTPGERLGLLPTGLSLPGGRTARPEAA